MQTTREFDRRVEVLLDQFSDYRKSLTPTLLQLAVEEFGTVGDDVFGWIAGLTGVPAQEVRAVAQYLDLLKPEPRARYRILVCTHVHCARAGSEEYLRQIGQELGLPAGGRTRAGDYELLKVQCLGCCEQAPAIQINRQHFVELTADRVREILDGLSKTRE